MDLINRIAEWKKNLNLPSAGSYENLHRDARSKKWLSILRSSLFYYIYFVDVALTNMIFEGGKADLAKGLSSNFQVAHSFTLGTAMQPASYHFASIYAAKNVNLKIYTLHSSFTFIRTSFSLFKL